MWRRTLTLMMASVTLATSGLSAQSNQAPTTGEAIVTKMHDAYAGTWFTTLTFVQKTTIVRDGTRSEQTWFESVKAPNTLRIDTAPLSNGNGSLNSSERAIVMRGGKIATTRPSGNPFLPFVIGIYTQPVADTMAQLALEHYNMIATHATTYKGRATWVVGASNDNDMSSPQFWVDTERLVVVRALLPSGPATQPMLDVDLDGYVRAGGGWLAKKVSMSIGGELRQLEEYTEERVNVALPNALFDPAHWMDAPHWAAGRGGR